MVNFLSFDKDERRALILILATIFLVSFFNFRVSERKARDFQRKADIRNITNSLEEFHKQFSFYPASKEGKIVGCNPKLVLESYEFTVCRLGEDKLAEKSLPDDPHRVRGVSYFYISNQTRFQVFAALEGTSEPEYSTKIVSFNYSCGTKVCNFALSSPGMPLDKSIEEYENELRSK